MSDCPPTRELSVEEWHQEYLRLAVYAIEALKELDESRHENARLRELVSVLAHCAAGYGCDLCPINGGRGMVGELDMCETVHARMRKLGVEVDG